MEYKSSVIPATWWRISQIFRGFYIDLVRRLWYPPSLRAYKKSPRSYLEDFSLRLLGTNESKNLLYLTPGRMTIEAPLII
jgi:hypothetical protein